MSDKLVNEDKVTKVRGDPVTDFWPDGVVDRYPDYRFNAKVFDVGGPFGIAQGRISKLEVLRRGLRDLPLSLRKPPPASQRADVFATIGRFSTNSFCTSSSSAW